MQKINKKWMFKIKNLKYNTLFKINLEVQTGVNQNKNWTFSENTTSEFRYFPNVQQGCNGDPVAG